ASRRYRMVAKHAAPTQSAPGFALHRTAFPSVRQLPAPAKWTRLQCSGVTITLRAVSWSGDCALTSLAPNNAFKPKPLRSTNHMAGTACHVVGSTTQLGLT